MNLYLFKTNEKRGETNEVNTHEQMTLINSRKGIKK